MATEGGQAAPVSDGAVKKEQKAPAKPQPKDQAQAEAAGAEKKISNAELKKRAKEEKAARRAQAKSTQIAPQAGQPGAQGAAGNPKTSGGKGATKPKDGGLPVPSHHRSASRSVIQPVVKEVMKPKIPECFSHLSMAKRIAMTQADKDVNPVVLALGQQMSTFAISDSITRLEATLLAFKKVRIRLTALAPEEQFY